MSSVCRQDTSLVVTEAKIANYFYIRIFMNNFMTEDLTMKNFSGLMKSYLFHKDKTIFDNYSNFFANNSQLFFCIVPVVGKVKHLSSVNKDSLQPKVCNFMASL